MKADQAPQTILLKDYQKPDYFVSEAHLFFDLHNDATIVRSRLEINRADHLVGAPPLVLNGQDLKLQKVRMNGQELKVSDYVLTPESLTIHQVSARCSVEIEVLIEPQKNLSCEGLYKSSGMFCTQCEAESFRRITFYPDRPDVMTVFTVTIEADKANCPVLLANGNLVETRDVGNGRHQAKWHDPHKKPSYLFAMVAGDLGCLEDQFVTRSGRNVQLQIYYKHGYQDRCQHAMKSLQQAMKWDEETFGLEYDLDIYMIVVADDFNMGAMENKGLNVFNSHYVLANPETATDWDFEAVQGVIGHEYFHNWTGNRVTCRDWFQLSLKEGLTVFRDQEFSADLGSRAVNRIDEVIKLRSVQFSEDAGPMAHPIRPASYISINNFYTATVYEKGSEVIRMIHTIIGQRAFRKGMDKYFELYDGQAVTTEDFVHAMQLASGVDLRQFKRWYDQAGTPVVKAHSHYNQKDATFTLTLSQSCPPTPWQDEKLPFHIPIAIGLLNSSGKEVPLHLDSDAESLATRILHLKEPMQTFVFKNIKEPVVPSLLRRFSAPVRLEYPYTTEDLSFLVAHDPDPFCRWEAAQLLAIRVVKEMVTQIQNGQKPQVSEVFVASFAPVITDTALDPAFKALMLLLPVEQYLAQFYEIIDVDAIHQAREQLCHAIAARYEKELVAIYETLAKTSLDKKWTAQLAAQRSLKGRALGYLVRLGGRYLDWAYAQRKSATTMTDELNALETLNLSESTQRELAMSEFYQKWKSESLVMNKWLVVQALSCTPHSLERVRSLLKDEVFDATNPNKINSLLVQFGMRNAVCFHEKSGAGYRFIADQILEIDERNHQVAARLATVFNQWRKYDIVLQDLIKAQLKRILAKSGLSSNVFEIVSKALN